MKIFSPMATNMHTISLTCENHTFFIVLFEEFVVLVIRFFQPYLGNRSHGILLKSKLPMLSVFIKHFDLSIETQRPWGQNAHCSPLSGPAIPTPQYQTGNFEYLQQFSTFGPIFGQKIPLLCIGTLTIQ